MVRHHQPPALREVASVCSAMNMYSTSRLLRICPCEGPVLLIQDAQKEAGSGSNGGLSQAAVAPRLQQSEEVVGMFGSETAARSGLLSSYSEMPASAVNHQRQVMKGSVSEVSPLSPAASLKLPMPALPALSWKVCKVLMDMQSVRWTCIPLRYFGCES